MIQLTAEQIKLLFRSYGYNVVEGYEGWYIECDYTSGEYMKGYFTDLELLLYDNNDVLRGIGIGGDYAQDEYHFDQDLIFEEPEPETDLIRFNQYLVEISEKALSLGDDLAEITAKLSKITQYVKKLTDGSRM
jgi:hypothetical protein